MGNQLCSNEQREEISISQTTDLSSFAIKRLDQQIIPIYQTNTFKKFIRRLPHKILQDKPIDRVKIDMLCQYIDSIHFITKEGFFSGKQKYKLELYQIKEQSTSLTYKDLCILQFQDLFNDLQKTSCDIEKETVKSELRNHIRPIKNIYQESIVRGIFIEICKSNNIINLLRNYWMNIISVEEEIIDSVQFLYSLLMEIILCLYNLEFAEQQLSIKRLLFGQMIQVIIFNHPKLQKKQQIKICNELDHIFKNEAPLEKFHILFNVHQKMIKQCMSQENNLQLISNYLQEYPHNHQIYKEMKVTFYSKQFIKDFLFEEPVVDSRNIVDAWIESSKYFYIN